MKKLLGLIETTIITGRGTTVIIGNASAPTKNEIKKEYIITKILGVNKKNSSMTIE